MLRSTFDFANRVLTRCIWRIPSETTEDCARRVDTLRLASRDWPRNPRSLWPSSPSVGELIAMSRRGITPTGLWKPPQLVVNKPRVQDLSKDLGLATRVISNNVIGLRSTVAVPRKFLPWFRYSRGILFLTVRYCIPAGLVRFLLAQWVTNPFNLWLKVNCRLKYYLGLVRMQDNPAPCGRTLPSQGLSTLEREKRGRAGPDYSSCSESEYGSSSSFGESRFSGVRRTQQAKLT